MDQDKDSTDQLPSSVDSPLHLASATFTQLAACLDTELNSALELLGVQKLAELTGISAVESYLLHAMVAIQVDRQYAHNFHDTFGSKVLTIDIALQMLDVDSRGTLQILPMFGSQSPLSSLGFMTSSGNLTLQDTLSPTKRGMSIVIGDSIFARMPSYVQPILDPSSQTAYAPATIVSADHIAKAMQTASGALCIVYGNVGVGKTTFAQTIASELATQSIVIDMEEAIASGPLSDLARSLQEVLCDCAVYQVTVILDNADKAFASGSILSGIVNAHLTKYSSKVIAVVHDIDRISQQVVGRALLRVEVPPPSSAQRTILWDSLLPISEATASELGDSFELTPSQICSAAHLSRSLSIPPTEAARSQLSTGNLLSSTTVKMGLDDLILDKDTRKEIVEFVGALRSRTTVMKDWGMENFLSRGRGISALFDGESGCGKTLACEVIAKEIRLPLMRVNVSTLIDKYVGETEKNLTRVFADARSRGVILLFDEADAIFGKRVGASSAHDRSANMETNLLLQLMEEHEGIVVMTTNLKQNIDSAFMRRISYKVTFTEPKKEHRLKLWDMHLPAGRVAEDVDLDSLANRFELSGGAIKNAVLRACYRAAGEGRIISMEDLMDCAQLESHALGKVTRSSL